MSRNGFTLVEVATVLVIAGIVLAAALPPFLSYSRSLSQEQAREGLVQDLRLARQRAVTAHRSVIVAFGDGGTRTGLSSYSVHTDTNGDRLKQPSEAWASQILPAGTRLARVELQPADSLIFDSSGALAPGSTGGRITVDANGHPDTLFVSATGMVYRP